MCPPLLPSSAEHLGRLGLIPALALMLHVSPPARTKLCAGGGKPRCSESPSTEEVQGARLAPPASPACGAELCQASLLAMPSLPCSTRLQNHHLIYLGVDSRGAGGAPGSPSVPPTTFFWCICLEIDESEEQRDVLDGFLWVFEKHLVESLACGWEARGGGRLARSGPAWALPGRWFKVSFSSQEDVRAGCRNRRCEAQSSLPSSLRGSGGRHALLSRVGVCRIRLGSL